LEASATGAALEWFGPLSGSDVGLYNDGYFTWTVPKCSIVVASASAMLYL